MPNTFTTNFNLTKPEVGGANDTWGTLINSNLTDLDTQLYRKADKNDQKGVTHTLTFTSGSALVTTNVTRGFASFAVGDKIDITHSGNAANKGEFKIEAITSDITLDLETLADAEPSFVTEDVSSTVSIMPEINVLDISGGTLTTSTAQKDAIVDGSTVLSRPQGVKSLTIAAGGSSYSGNGTLAATGGGGSGFSGTYIESGGAIYAVAIVNAGSGYTTAPTIVSTPTVGSAGTSGSITSTVYTLNDLTFAGSVSLAGDLSVIGSSGVGRPKIVKCMTLTGTNYQTNHTTNEVVGHNAVKLPVISGKTYIVNVDFTMYLRDEGDDGNINVFLRLYADTTTRTQGTNTGGNSDMSEAAYNNPCGYKELLIQPGATSLVHYHIQPIFYQPVKMTGVFTAGSSTDRYIFFTSQSFAHTGARHWPWFDEDASNNPENTPAITYVIEEVDSLTIETQSAGSGGDW